MIDPVFRYKGFSGSIEYSREDNCFHGKILYVDDLVTYEGRIIAQLDSEFRDSVDDYRDTLIEVRSLEADNINDRRT